MQIVMGGDFDCALAPLDKTGGTSTERKKTVINKIKNLCTNFDLQDVWRLQHPGVSQYTWRNNWLWLLVECVMQARLLAGFKRMDPLHGPVTWYNITSAGTQVAQWDFQNKGGPRWTGRVKQ